MDLSEILGSLQKGWKEEKQVIEHHHPGRGGGVLDPCLGIGVPLRV